MKLNGQIEQDAGQGVPVVPVDWRSSVTRALSKPILFRPNQSAQCGICSRYITGAKCIAFPDGIPQVILTGEHDHRKPFAGDRGIHFDPLSQVSDEALEDTMDLVEEDEGNANDADPI